MSMSISISTRGNRPPLFTTLLLVAVLLAAGGCGLRPDMAPEIVAPHKETPGYVAKLEPPDLAPGDDAVSPGSAYFYFIRGKSAELAGRLDEARYAYQQVLLRDRTAVHVMRSLTMLLLRQNQRQEAIVWAQRMAELQPDDIDTLALLANLHTVVGESLKAAAIYREILAIDPGNAKIMLLLGKLYVGDDQPLKALALLEELVAQHPDFFPGHYYLARLYLELEQVTSAMAAYERALVLNWSPLLAQEVAAAYTSAGLYEESRRLYQQIIADDPTDKRARSLLADTYLRLNRVDAALTELAELRHYITDPDHRDHVDLTIARILLDEGRLKESLALLYTITGDEPRLDAIRSLMVTVYYRLDRVDRAHLLLEEVRSGDYGYEDAVLMAARLYYASSQPVAAAQVLTRALGDPDHRYLSFYVTLALLHIELHDAGQGVRVFERALRELGPIAPVLLEYARYLDRIGNIAGAMDKMQRVIALDPQNPYALNYVGYTWADRGENLEQALIYIKEAVRLRPEDGAIRNSLGWVFYRLGDYHRAVAELELAVELLADDPELYDHLGDAYRKLSQREDALNAYRRALELLDPESDGEKYRAIKNKIEELM